MKSYRILLALALCLLLLPSTSFAQTNTQTNAQAESLYQKAITLEERGEMQEAIETFKDAIEADIHFVPAHLRYQRLLASEKRYEFLDEYNNLAFDHPKDAIIQFLFGNALAHHGQLDKAKKYFTIALERDPRCHWAMNGMGTYYQMKEKYLQALTFYEDAIAIQPNFTQAYINRGILRLNQAKSDPYSNREKLRELAIQDFSKAIAISPRDLQAHQARLTLYREEGNTDKMDEALSEIIGLTPERPELFLERARLRISTNDIERAMDDLQDALRLKGNYHQARILRANLFLALRRVDDAFADFDLACQSSSNKPEPFLARGLANVALGKLEAALRDFDSGIRIAPNNANAYVNRGSAYFRSGKEHYGKALDDFGKAIELDARYFEAYLNRGSVHAAMGQYAAAAADYRYAQKLEPGNQGVLAKLDATYGQLEKQGADIGDKRDIVRRKRLQELQEQVQGMSLPEKSIFIAQMCKDIREKPEFQQSALDILDTLLRDTDWQVRCATVKYLGSTYRMECASVLVAPLQDEDRHVRGAAIMALARTMNVEAVPHLIPMLLDNNEYVSKEALRFLQDLSGQDFSSDETTHWNDWWSVQNATQPDDR